MASNLIKRYVWLINTIKGNSLTFEEISKKWEVSSLNEKREKLPQSTFIRHKRSIEALGIKIDFHKSNNTYSINDTEEIQSSEKIEWMINSFSVLNMLQEGYKLKERILFEPIPSGSEHLIKIVEAIKSNRELVFAYNKFGDSIGKTIEGTPYCLKIKKQRWYVLVPNEGKLKNYALDRITDLTISNKESDFPKNFSLNEYYRHSIGMYVDEENPVESVKIEVSGIWVNLLRTLPLHNSQNETILNDNTSIFDYRIRIDVEVISEILKMGESAKVIEPLTLVKKMKDKMREMIKLYGTE